MATLHSLMAVYGALDRAVVRTGHQSVAAAVERYLPGTTGSNSGWFDSSNAWAILSFCSLKRRQLSPECCHFAQPLDALFRP